jgi:hypothetical protein
MSETTAWVIIWICAAIIGLWAGLEMSGKL